jgi:pyridoxal phosphate enzyme (YggS family)
MDLKSKKEQLDRRIAKAARRCGRTPSDVTLLAVSKTMPADRIRSLAALGQKSFGENYLQEAVSKIEGLADLQLDWHFIGQIQRNKTRLVAETFDWVQSIDRLVIAERLSNQRPDEMDNLNICIQVRMSDEENKGGVSPDSLFSLAREVDTLPRLVLRGLMAIPENTTDTGRQRDAFKQMNELFKALKMQYDTVDTLSMGMSGDFELAIEEGSTLVRIGTLLFGPRKN